MSLRHMPRQSDRDVRMHDPPPPAGVHPHPLLTHPPPPPGHPAHLNGGVPIPTTPGGLSNGSAHGPPHPPSAHIVSPAVVPNAPPSNGVAPKPSSVIHQLAVANEQTWLLIGRVAEQMNDLEHAISAYENALRHNPMSLPGLTQVAGIARIKENYPKAIEYFQRVISMQEDNGEVWSALGHCYLMQDDLQKAYAAYQQALYLLPNPKEDPKLWYGIGILYDRYGSLDHAEEAFASVLKMEKDLDFDKANEILFRLGIIYKQQGKYDESLGCFDRILRNPPIPLAHADIWFQIGHVYEQQKDHVRAKDAYERVVADNPGHAKVLQQLGWLYHQDGSSFQNQELAVQYLTKSLEADPSDAQSWYLLGRAYMAGQKYNKAYEAYQQAVYRDGRNPTFWCSIGVLYFQINQFRDALDAYSRAIRINPYISEVWFDLGSLYESCNNQISDAIDAYARASELDPSNPLIAQRLQLLKNAQATGGQLPAAPGPQDVHPTAYASAVVPPPGLTGPPLMLQSSANRPIFRSDSRGPSDGVHLPPPPPPAARSSPGPFRGGPPPPVIIDESRHAPSHTPLAPMEVDRPPHPREFPGPGRDGPSRGPAGHQNLLLHHPIPQQQVPPEELRHSAVHGPGQHQEYLPRGPLRVPSPSASPPPRARSPYGYAAHPSAARPPVGPAQGGARTPPPYARDGRPVDPDVGWERRAPPPEHHRDWDRDLRRERPEYTSHPSQQPYYPSPVMSSPKSRPHWHYRASGHRSTPPPPPPPPPENGHRGRYDPARYDARDSRGYESGQERRASMTFAGSPEGPVAPPPHYNNSRTSESPHLTSGMVDPKTKRRSQKDRDADAQSVEGMSTDGNGAKKERKRRQKRKDDQGREMSSVSSGPPFKVAQFPAKEGPVVVHDASSSATSSRSVQPSPTGATPRPPSRVVDEDYDEGVADALVGLSQARALDMNGPGVDAAMHSPTISSGSRRADPSPRPGISHRESVSSTRSRASPLLTSGTLKRPLSPGPDDMDTKRSRVDVNKRSASSPSGDRHTPVPSSRPSPIPFRTQPSSHSPESRAQPEPTSAHTYPAASPPSLATMLPPHPRPNGQASGVSINLPPITTLSPTTSTAPSPTEERMAVDVPQSTSPPSRGKLSEVINRASASPNSKSGGSPTASRVLDKKPPSP